MHGGIGFPGHNCKVPGFRFGGNVIFIKIIGSTGKGG